MELVRVVTAGSIDDGKSTLIGRLLRGTRSIYQDQEKEDLAHLVDGLKAEQEQGITIDVAYRQFETEKRRFVLADSPGHERYTRNMVVGCSTADIAIILTDITKGLTLQGKRHAFIASLLGVPHVIFAINKMDLVDYDREHFSSVVDQWSSFCEKLKLRSFNFIPISAKKGENITEDSGELSWYKGGHILSQLDNINPIGNNNLVDFRLPIQGVNLFKGKRYLYGEIASGIIRIDEEVIILPHEEPATIQEISTLHGLKKGAGPGQSIEILIKEDRDIQRGSVIVRPGNIPSKGIKLSAYLIWLGENPYCREKALRLKLATQEVLSQVTNICYLMDPVTLHRCNTEGFNLNDIGRVDLETYQEIIFEPYMNNREMGSFLLIDSDTNETCAAGLVIKKLEDPVYRPLTLWMTGLSGSGKTTIARELKKHLHKASVVLDGDEIRSRLNVDLGFTEGDRNENIRRVAEICRILNDNGITAIVSLISPRGSSREMAKEIIGDCFREIYISTPLEVCEERDPKGLYKKARNGEIESFTGVSAPYEPPLSPDLILNNESEGLKKIIERLKYFLGEENRSLT